MTIPLTGSARTRSDASQHAWQTMYQTKYQHVFPVRTPLAGDAVIALAATTRSARTRRRPGGRVEDSVVKTEVLTLSAAHVAEGRAGCGPMPSIAGRDTLQAHRRNAPIMHFYESTPLCGKPLSKPTCPGQRAPVQFTLTPRNGQLRRPAMAATRAPQGDAMVASTVYFCTPACVRLRPPARRSAGGRL